LLKVLECPGRFWIASIVERKFGRFHTVESILEGKILKPAGWI